MQTNTNLIKEVLKKRKITQKELLKELQEIEPKLDKSLLSKMAKGIVAPTPIVQEWLFKSVATNGERGKEENGVIVPFDNKTLLKTKIEEKAFSIIKGQKDIKMSELASTLGVNERQVRTLVQNMRKKGIRIAGDSNGYHICENEKEYLAYRKEYATRVFNELAILKAMDNYVEGQEVWQGTV